MPARWVVGDAAYGSDGKLRRALKAWRHAYALAVKSTEKPTTWRTALRPTPGTA